MDPFQDFLSRIGLDLSAASNQVGDLLDHVQRKYAIVPGTLVAGQTVVSLKHGLGRPVYAGYPIAQTVGAALSVKLVTGSTNQTDVIVQVPAALASDVSFLLFCF